MIRKSSVRLLYSTDEESIAISVDGDFSRRTTRSQVNMAHKILRGKLWALRNLKNNTNKEVATYDLPDEEPWPHELITFKNDL